MSIEISLASLKSVKVSRDQISKRRYDKITAPIGKVYVVRFILLQLSLLSWLYLELSRMGTKWLQQ